jgi:hypothetical protein
MSDGQPKGGRSPGYGHIIILGILAIFAMNAWYYYSDVVTTREKMLVHKKATGQ